MREKLGSCSFCIRWSTRGFAISILLLIASIYLRITPLIVISAAVFTFFSVLTTLHFIFYVRRREKCIRRVSGESRRRFISTAFKLVAGLALYSIIGRIPRVIAQPEPIESVEIPERQLKEFIEEAKKSVDLRNIADVEKLDFSGSRGFIIKTGSDTQWALAIPVAEGSFLIFRRFVNGSTAAEIYEYNREFTKLKLASLNGKIISPTNSTCSPPCQYPYECICYQCCTQWNNQCLILCAIEHGICGASCIDCVAGNYVSCAACLFCIFTYIYWLAQACHSCCVGSWYTCNCHCVRIR